MAHYLDLESWNRRQHFDFFRSYDNPFFNLCAPLDVTALRAVTGGATGVSFSLAAFYLSLRAANETEPFRYRLRGDRVLVHEVIHGGSTVLRDDESFGFSYFDWDPDFAGFHAGAAAALAAAKTETDLSPRPDRDDLIHYSVIPWVAFTSFAHARRWGGDESVPKIVFGKVCREAGVERLPVSVEVHHALMDGLHVGRYLERLQRYFSQPPLSP